MSRSVEIRSADASDTAWLEQIMDEEWGGPFQVANRNSYRPTDLPCVIAELDGERVGYAALRVVGDVAWIGVIGSLRARQGVGSALVARLATDARSQSCPVLRAITTNENSHTQDFYRALGFRLIRSGPVRSTRAEG